MSAVMTIEELRTGLAWRKNLDKAFVVVGLAAVVTAAAGW